MEGFFHLYVHRWGKWGDTGASVASWMFSCYFGCHLQLQIFVIDGYSQTEFGALFRVSQPAVAGWESGTNSEQCSL